MKTILGHFAALLLFASAIRAQDPAPSAPPSVPPESAAPMVPPSAAPEIAPVSAPAPSPAPTTTPAPVVTGPPPVSVEIDLTEQKAYLLKNGHKVSTSPISSGRAGHLTPTGDFHVLEKDLNHKSSLYGKIVDKSGRTVIAGADSAMSVPKGCHFLAAPMKYFVRFEGAQGTHIGQLPGYPASHGCVRMPAEKAILLYKSVEIGTPVHVFGHAPTRKISSRFVVKNAPAHAQPQLAPAPMMEPQRRSIFDRMFGRNKPQPAPNPAPANPR